MATFGNTNIQTLSTGIGGMGYIGGRFQLTQAGVVTKLTGYCSSVGVPHNCKGVIYTDKAGPLPDARVCYSDDVAVQVAGWYDFPLTHGTTSLAPGWYWLYWEISDADLRVQYEAVGGVDNYFISASYDTPPDDPCPTAFSGTPLLSIYATYTPAAPKGTIAIHAKLVGII